LHQKTLIPATSPTREPPLIGLITYKKEIEPMSIPEPLCRGVSRLFIGEISYILHTCQSFS